LRSSKKKSSEAQDRYDFSHRIGKSAPAAILKWGIELARISPPRYYGVLYSAFMSIDGLYNDPSTLSSENAYGHSENPISKKNTDFRSIMINHPVHVNVLSRPLLGGIPEIKREAYQ